MILDVERAGDHDVSIGDTVQVVLSGGNEIDVTVEAISDDENLLGYFTITRDTFLANAKAPLDTFLYGTVDEGADIDEVIDAASRRPSRGPPACRCWTRRASSAPSPTR